MAISFQSQYQGFVLKQPRKLRSWINSVIQKEKKRCGDLNLVFVSDEALYEVNVKYLNHHTYTDIISFDSVEGDVVNGDIMISIDRVKENAAAFNVSFEQELHRVMIHGVLHFCGYKDKGAKHIAIMRAKEDAALRLLKRL